jgi:hypothetical protein
MMAGIAAAKAELVAAFDAFLDALAEYQTGHEAAKEVEPSKLAPEPYHDPDGHNH